MLLLLFLKEMCLLTCFCKLFLVVYYNSDFTLQACMQCQRTWECLPKRTKCADGVQCVPVAHLCNGKADCEDGSDEEALTLLDTGQVNNCSLPLSPCVSIGQQWWLDEAREGARCDEDTCLDRASFCDGVCHCQVCARLNELIARHCSAM